MSRKSILFLAAAALATVAVSPAMAQRFGADTGIRPSQTISIQCAMGSQSRINLINQGTPIPQGTIVTVTYLTPLKVAPKSAFAGGAVMNPKYTQVTATYRAKHTIRHADTELTDLVGHSCLSATWVMQSTLSTAQP